MMIMKSVVALLCVLTLASSEWIDMSYTYDNTTHSWGSSTPFQHTIVVQGRISDEIPYLSTFDIKTAEHCGTHIDAPIHFAKGKWTVDQIPADRLVGAAIVVNISVKAAQDRNAQLTVDDIKMWEKKHGKIPDDCIMFVFTGWGRFWLEPEKYFGTSSPKNDSLYRFPGISENAAKWLVENRKIKGIGIDTASIDPGSSKYFKSHQTFYTNNIFGLEDVANLHKLPPTGAIVFALPMKIGKGSGGPVRIFATTSKEFVGHNSASSSWFGTLWLTVLVLISFV